jgi:hypothetical protein
MEAFVKLRIDSVRSIRWLGNVDLCKVDFIRVFPVVGVALFVRL